MPTLIRIFELVTADALSMAAAGALALGVIGLLLVVSWPSSDAPSRAGISATRSMTARSLAAAGTPALEIARRTGLSRDALALVLGGKVARQNSPQPARFSLFRRFKRPPGHAVGGRQVAA